MKDKSPDDKPLVKDGEEAGARRKAGRFNGIAIPAREKSTSHRYGRRQTARSFRAENLCIPKGRWPRETSAQSFPWIGKSSVSTNR